MRNKFFPDEEITEAGQKRPSQFQVLCKPSLWCRIEIH